MHRSRVPKRAASAAHVKALANVCMNDNVACISGELGLDLAMLRDDGEDMQNRDLAVYSSTAYAAEDSDIEIARAAGVGTRFPLGRGAND